MENAKTVSSLIATHFKKSIKHTLQKNV